MTPKSSNDFPTQSVRKDTSRETRKAVVEDAAETDVADRDLVHGDGGTVGIGPSEDLSRDD